MGDRGVQFNPDTLTEMEKDGWPADMAFRLAVTMVGSVQWELIQPLNDQSMLRRFLATKGPGLHHVAVAAPNFAEAKQTLEAKGRRCSRAASTTVSGSPTCRRQGHRRDHRDLRLASGHVQTPDAVYPPE